MTHIERIHALKPWGFSVNQASFIATAILTGGYFLHRQLRSYLNSASQADNAVRYLIDRGWATKTTLRYGWSLYHLTYTPMYELMHLRDSGGRRMHQPYAVKARVMALDYVLQNAARRALLTPEEKMVGMGELRVDDHDLPAQDQAQGRAYFPDRFPILAPDQKCPASFSFIDPGARTLSGFSSWLERHARIFGVLREFEVVYCSTTSELIPVVADRFHRAMRSIRKAEFSPVDLEMMEYFSMQRKIDQKQMRAFDAPALDRYGELRHKYGIVETKDLYRRWLVDGDVVFGASSSERARFRSHLMGTGYEIFASLFVSSRVGGPRRNSRVTSPSTNPVSSEQEWMVVAAEPIPARFSED